MNYDTDALLADYEAVAAELSGLIDILTVLASLMPEPDPTHDPVNAAAALQRRWAQEVFWESEPPTQQTGEGSMSGEATSDQRYAGSSPAPSTTPVGEAVSPNPSEDFFAPSARDEDPLHADLKAMVKAHAISHPRHAQIALGPSEIGHPCARNVISGLIGTPAETRRTNPQFDVLPSYLGVAGHRQMEDAAALDNARMFAEFEAKCAEITDPETRMHTLDTFQARWLPERKVKVSEGLSGTCDLYDTQTDTVIDYKFPGVTKMTEYRKLDAAGKPPSIIYQVQAHLYGKGYRNEGFDVKRVGIWFLPRSGLLSTALLWTEEYNEDLVQEQLSRLESLILLLHDMELEDHPERLAMIPITPYNCGYCPWFSVNPQRTNDNPFACAGGEQYQPQITDHSGAVPV